VHGLFEWNLYIKEIDQIIQIAAFFQTWQKAKANELLSEGVSPEISFR